MFGDARSWGVELEFDQTGWNQASVKLSLLG